MSGATMDVVSPLGSNKCSFGIHHTDPIHGHAVATVAIHTGAAHVQTYLTADECERLAAMLTTAAQEVRAMQGEEVAA